MKIFLAIVIALIVGFLVGYAPMALNKAELTSELDTSRDALKLSEERAEKAELNGAALNDFIGAYRAAMEKNYGIAQTRAISGFQRAKALSEMGIEPFGKIVSRRDEIVSILAKATDDAQPEVRLLLFSLYKE